MNTSPKLDHKTKKPLLPSTSSYLPLVLGGSYWDAQDSFKNIVVFGDSYSSSYQGRTWVNYLTQQLQQCDCSPLVHNFAAPGHTAGEDLDDQVSHFFTRFPEKESSDAIPALDLGPTTYFVFLGINDCGRSGSNALQVIIENLFDTLHELYVKAQARNFLLIDVPPVDRSPQAIQLECSEKLEKRVKKWNELLRTQAIEFQSNSTDATMLLFSSHKFFTDILDDPMEYEFTEDDPETEGGGIWVDYLHPTSEVHDLFGELLFASVLNI